MPVSEKIYNLFFGEGSGIIKQEIINNQMDIRTNDERFTLGERFDEVKQEFLNLKDRLKIVKSDEDWRKYFLEKYKKGPSDVGNGYNFRKIKGIISEP